MVAVGAMVVDITVGVACGVAVGRMSRCVGVGDGTGVFAGVAVGIGVFAGVGFTRTVGVTETGVTVGAAVQDIVNDKMISSDKALNMETSFKFITNRNTMQ